MLRVASAQLLADDGIRVCPKTRKIIRDLLRPVVGREQVQEHLDASAGNSRCIAQSKQFLNANREHRWPTLFICDGHSTSAWDFNALGSFALNSLLLSVRQFATECLFP